MTDSVISELPVERLVAQRRRAARNAAAASNFAQYRASLRVHVVPLTLSIAVAIVIWIGWVNREDSGLTPQSGVGYWLGIVGSSFMVLLLLYPLRKRMKFLRLLGTVVFWFRAHMILGVLGPALIL